MAVGGVDDQKVDAGVDQPLGALEAVVADRALRQPRADVPADPSRHWG